MKPALSSLLIVLLIGSLFICTPVLAQNHAITPETVANATAETTLTDDSEIDPDIVKGTGLCVGGAIIGSIVPVLGTIIGCGVGVAFAWFTRIPEAGIPE